MNDHPFPPGTRIYHTGQQWAHRVPGGTGEVVRIASDLSSSSNAYAEGDGGAYEYQVRTGRDFSLRPGPDNPEDRLTTWSGWAIRRATSVEQGESFEALMQRLRKLTPEERAELIRLTSEMLATEEEGPALTEAFKLDDALQRVETSAYGASATEL